MNFCSQETYLVIFMNTNISIFLQYECLKLRLSLTHDTCTYENNFTI